MPHVGHAYVVAIIQVIFFNKMLCYSMLCQCHTGGRRPPTVRVDLCNHRMHQTGCPQRLPPGLGLFLALVRGSLGTSMSSSSSTGADECLFWFWISMSWQQWYKSRWLGLAQCSRISGGKKAQTVSLTHFTAAFGPSLENTSKFLFVFLFEENIKRFRNFSLS